MEKFMCPHCEDIFFSKKCHDIYIQAMHPTQWMTEQAQAFRGNRKSREKQAKESLRTSNNDIMLGHDIEYRIDKSDTFLVRDPRYPFVNFYPTKNKWWVLATKEMHYGDAKEMVAWLKEQTEGSEGA